MEGEAIGSSVGPTVVNLYMKDFENKALRTAENPPGLYKRYVDDTLVIEDIEQKDKSVPLINSIDKAIKFTVEDTRPDETIPF